MKFKSLLHEENYVRLRFQLVKMKHDYYRLAVVPMLSVSTEGELRVCFDEEALPMEVIYYFRRQFLRY